MVLGLQSPFLLFWLIANSSYGSTLCHVSQARNVGPCVGCTCTCLPTIAHGHDITIVSYGCAVVSPTGCQKVYHVFARRGIPAFFLLVHGVPAHALLTVEVNLQCQRLIIVLYIQDNLKCHMRQGTKHSQPTYAYNYNKI